MEDSSRPASPDAPPQDLWLSILDSVSSSRSIPSKQVLLLGPPSSGKSTLAAALLQRPPADGGKDDAAGHDFALGYDWADVRDEGEGEEADILARLSVYTVPSSAQSYTSLVPHFLPSRTALPHTVAVIVLDWTKPWTFVDELLTWLNWIEAWVSADTSREATIAREENRERLQHYFQHYTEPSTEPIPATTTTLQDTVLEIPPGALTNNVAGVPIIVACSKADLIDDNTDIVGAGATGMGGGMVKGKGGEWEERTDGIMQVVRTICMRSPLWLRSYPKIVEDMLLLDRFAAKMVLIPMTPVRVVVSRPVYHGAALFYTTPQPSTLQVLRQYALHMLFAPPAPVPGAEAAAPPRNPFPFAHKPNTLDRDRIVVPTGWDSWGKITLLRDGFDARAWGDAWERALAPAEGADGPTATRMYAQLVPDQGPKPQTLPQLNEPVPEQTFLAKNYDEIAKRGDKDPRGIFRNPAETPAAGVVGPLGSTSLGLPAVERALEEMEGGASPALGSTTSTRRPGASAASAPRGALAASQGPRSPATPAPPGGPGATSNHEVLHNFFQSLLTSNNRAGASAAAAAQTSPPPPGPAPRNDGGGGGGGEAGSGGEDGGSSG